MELALGNAQRMLFNIELAREINMEIMIKDQIPETLCINSGQTKLYFQWHFLLSTPSKNEAMPCKLCQRTINLEQEGTDLY